MPGTQSITGLQSGLDTTSIVDQLIELERGNALLLENEVEYKTSVISAFKALEANFLALSSEVSSLKRASTFEAYSVNVSDSDYLGTSTTGRAGVGSYDIQVLSLARNHQMASQGFDDVAANDMGTGTITLQLGDGTEQTITIDSENNSLLDIKNAINKSGADISATIVNDGSESNPYRLILSGDKTGRKNNIKITSDLSGGLNLNFATGSFDIPETITAGSGSTAEITLGAGAVYGGTENKTYTFTVAGDGEQTIGDGPITINWTDGVNSGSIEVSASDAEVALSGGGADGLTLSFGSGVLTAGDEFTVSTFTPLLQEATDARISLGSAGGTGSPITVSSSTNTFKDVIGGVTLTTKKVTSAGDSVSVKTELNTSSIEAKIKSFISAYNEVVEFIDDQNTYNTDEETSGILFGDTSVWSMQNSIRNAVSSPIDGITSKYNQLYAIGIRSKADGTLGIVDQAKLDDALQNNLDEVINLFIGSGETSRSGIEFVSSTALTKTGESFEVDITQAATRGSMAGAVIDDPSGSPIVIDDSNNQIKLTVDGLESEIITLSAGTYSSTGSLVEEIQAGIDADEKLSGRGVKATWVDTGSGQGYLKISSGSYGSKSTVVRDSSISNSAYSVLGWASATEEAGLDVAGTINGESAEGTGQYLLGTDGNETTDGLRLRITLTEDDLVEGVEGSITPTKGVAAKLDDIIDSLTRAVDGVFARRTAALQKEIEEKEERVEQIDERLAIRRETLLNQFYEMESALSELSAQRQYLEAQLASINNNWNFAKNSSKNK